MDDRLLVKRAKRGDVDAFAELYGKIYEKLYRFAFYMLKNAQDAEDAVSEAVTDAFEGIRGLKREESFANWMYQIVANKCRRKMREYCRRTSETSKKLTLDKCMTLFTIVSDLLFHPLLYRTSLRREVDTYLMDMA